MKHLGAPPRQALRQWVAAGTAVLAALTVVGLVALWPRGDAPDIAPFPRDFLDGTIISADTAGRCTDLEYADVTSDCVTYDVRLSSGPENGDTVRFSVRPAQTDVPELAVGDDIVLRHFPDSPAEFRYAFADFQRTTPLVLLLVAFVAVVLAFGRLQGLRALAGLGLSLVVLTGFVVPALLRDSPTITIALAGSAAVAFLAVYLAHGVNISSTIALAGTLVSLALTCILAVVVAAATHLSGLASQEAQTLRVTADALDLRGLLIAGIVIGALGVLDDVTVSQVSTVAALRRANPAMGTRALYREATRVGRDHVASAVNTLVLAYAGASLPLLLFFDQGGLPVSRLLTGELMAVEIVRMLVGSIGLVLSVPATTFLAAAILDDSDSDPHHAHGHSHLPTPSAAAPAATVAGSAQEGPRHRRTTPPDDTVRPWF